MRAEHLDVPVLIIGAGAAGLRAALELTARGVGCLVLGKRSHGDAHTRWAAGGINAALGTRDPEDSWQHHFVDTVREGHFVCDPAAVELLCRQAPDRVRELRDWGCAFSETDGGEIDQRYFGAQTWRRTCFAGDRTGEAILETLVSRAGEAGVPHRDHVFVTRILVRDGHACGAVGVDLRTGRDIVVHADAVILAAGGATSAWRRSSSRVDENNGDAGALALHAGAVLQDMEFVQFHPTGMMHPPAMRGRLVTEAVRGEGGRLYNVSGERFMEHYSPERLELDARDVVARAIYREIRDGRGTERRAVLLDISHEDAAYIRERLPKLVAQLAEHGTDLTQDAVEVAPTAHYSMGGVQVDFATGATSVPGLYAAGEATAGVHGANRLGGNSLAETVVFGRIAGAAVAAWVAQARRRVRATDAAVEAALAAHREIGCSADDATALLDEAGELLWDHAGIIRTAAGLREGLDRLAELQSRADAAGGGGGAGGAGSAGGGADGGSGFSGDIPGDALQRAFELRYTLLTAEAILRSALQRDESRGAHYREDAPDTAARWQRNIVCRLGEDGALELDTEPVAGVPEALRAFMEHAAEPHYHHLE
jgi:succinate dehydrogenase / fumarate reductase, flavoprotein subunit